MKVTYNWLKEYVEINDSPEIVAEKLTKCGMEVEEIVYQNEHLHDVVVGKILKQEKHPNAERLSVNQVDVGDKIVQIITAATNVKVGDLVPVSLPGADLVNGIQIKASNLRGIESYGMFCSGEELGIEEDYYEGASFNGILILKENYLPGTKIEDALSLNDVIFDVNVTANRPDCMSVLGIARELCAIYNKKIKPINLEYQCKFNKNIEDCLKINVSNYSLCPRYMGAMIDSINIAKSPLWLRRRLHAVGIKCINNLVDITNYVLVEVGQPMHAFDYLKLENKEINVRTAVNGEKISVLNQNEYELNQKNLVICDGKKPVAIAGIIGGVESSIGDETKIAVLESASFERASVRITGRKLGIRTDATARFEKGVDLFSPSVGLYRALNLIYELKVADIYNGVIDKKEKEIKNRVVEASISFIDRLLGVKIPNETKSKLLSNLGLENTVNGDILKVEVPAYREDIENYADIAEEIIRLYGYDVYNELDSKLFDSSKYTSGNYNPLWELGRKLKNILIDDGYYEALNFSIVNKNQCDLLNMAKDNIKRQMIKVSNPLSEDLEYLRTSMAHMLLINISYNQKRNNKNIRLFEIGKVYLPTELPIKELPNEKTILAFAVSENNYDFFNIKNTIENLMMTFDMEYEIDYSTEDYLHKGISADIYDKSNHIKVGSFGKIHPKVSSNYEIIENTYYGELDLDYLLKYTNKHFNVKNISKFPAVSRDLSLVMDENVRAEDIVNAVKKSLGNYACEVNIFDIYRNAQLGENKKSISINFKMVDNEKTLTDEVVNNLVNKIIKDLKYKCGAVLR